MPHCDRGPVCGGVAVAPRVLDLDDPVWLCLHVARADFFSGTQQIRRVCTLVGDEDHVHLSQRVDGLHGDVVGIAGPDTDELYPSHAELSPDNAAPPAGAMHGGWAAASSSCWRTCTISPMTTMAGAAKFAARASAAMHVRLDTSTRCFSKVAEAIAAAGVLPGSPPRSNAAAIFSRLRNPMYRTIGWRVRASADQSIASSSSGP